MTEAHWHQPEELQERAMMFVLGTLAADAAAQLTQHGARGCPECTEALRQAQSIHDGLLEATPAVPPRPELKQRVLDAVRQHDSNDTQIWKRWTQHLGQGLHTVRDEETPWEDTAFQGVRVRRLHVDESSDSISMLVQMDAGASYPPHRHGGTEVCLVVSGDLRVNDQILGPGDFQAAPTGSHHGEQSTEGGCTLFIVSSRADELTS